MATPLTGIPTPTYGADTWTVLASMAASLEALGVVNFATEAARNTAIPTPREGQTCYIAGTSGGISVHTPTGWRYLAWRP